MLSLLTESVPPHAKTLMDAFWPGPLTILLNARAYLSEYLTAGTHKIAVRIPGRSFALLLAMESGFPITATSANPSGLPPSGNVGTVLHYFGDLLDLAIDGGETPGGLPSTIVDAAGEGAHIIREGAITKESLQD